MKPWREELLSVLGEGKDAFVSGEDLAARFGCSRAAVWKKISILRSEGHPIEAVTNRGYRMTDGAPAMKAAIYRELKEAGLEDLFRISVTDSTPSTNLLARDAGLKGEPEFSVFVTRQQTAGRGRRGRTWISEPDSALLFSVLLRPDVPPAEASMLTLLFGLCILDALEGLCNIPVGIKWPNDIVSLQNGKKLCGILSETSMEENRISYAVAGCGINLSQKEFPSSIEDKATSLTLEGFEVRKEVLLAAILREIARRYPRFLLSPSGFLPEYRANCATLGRRIRTGDEGIKEGIATDIDDRGDLLVQWADGTVQALSSGEVSVRGMLGYF